MSDLDTLTRAFESLSRQGSVSSDAWPEGWDPAVFGLSEREGRLLTQHPFSALQADRIRQALNPRAAAWLRRLEVHAATSSTSTLLMQRALTGSIDGHACLAEVQLQGRGRRGRGWISPFGGSIALSLGINLQRSGAEIGGASLVVGLAVLDALEQVGVSGAGLKWPNDILLDEGKLGGILIEVAPGSGASRLVVGIGLNVVLAAGVRASVDRTVADLERFGPPSRNLLVGKMMSSVREFLDGFDRRGFEPFRGAFCDRHRYHGRACRVLLGDRSTAGRVVGVSEHGGLLLDTGRGVEEFHGGEVSLRETDGPADARRDDIAP